MIFCSRIDVIANYVRVNIDPGKGMKKLNFIQFNY